ncbi:MAG: FAD-dependent oxidoreductase [Nitrospira sp.]|nr:FAD-dependent oxidoreductase [Nitrospira sp.]
MQADAECGRDRIGETAGVEYDKHGITVNARLQTTNPSIYTAGDVCSRYKFTHAADAMAQIVQNALFPHPFGLGYASVDSLVSALVYLHRTGSGACRHRREGGSGEGH